MRRTPAKSLTAHPSHCTRRVSPANCLSSFRCQRCKGTIEPAGNGFSRQSTQGEKRVANIKRGQSRVKRRAALVSVVVLCTVLALSGWRGGLHAGSAAPQPAQAAQHLLAEGGGPPGHQTH